MIEDDLDHLKKDKLDKYKPAAEKYIEEQKLVPEIYLNEEEEEEYIIEAYKNTNEINLEEIYREALSEY